VACVAATLLFSPQARAGTDPAPATLTQLAYDGSTLAGVVTLRATTGDVVVDPASLQVTVAGATATATVESATTMRRAVFLVVDTSGSMKANSGMPIIKSAVAEFLGRVPADVSVGLISFANVAGVDVGLTQDKAKIQAASDGLSAAGETALYDAVTLALDKLGTTGDRSIVILSDGVNTVGRSDLGAVLNAVTQAGVRVDTIGLRTKVTADEVLTKMATAGGGNFAPADNEAAVTSAFSASARALDRQVMWTVHPGTLPLGDVPVEVHGLASGAPFVATGTVVVSSAPTALPSLTLLPPAPEASAPKAAPVQTFPAWLLLLGIVCTFLGLLGLTVAAVAPTMRTRRENRIQNLEVYAARGPQVTKPRRDTSSVIASNLVDIGERVMAGRESTSRTMALLQRADLAWRPGEWAVLRVLGVVVGIIGGALIFRDGLVAFFGVLVGALAGLFLPSVILRMLARRRAAKLERQLPDILVLLASSLSTGFSLPQALDAVAKDVSEPAAKEFSRVMAETRIGSDLESAMERMAIRMDSDNMRWTSMAIGIQRQVGGNLAETLRTTAATLREREYLRRHVSALSAEGRLSAYILIAIPIILFVYEVNVNRAYISLLWTTVLGWVMIVGSLILMAIGIFWMNKAVKVEV